MEWWRWVLAGIQALLLVVLVLLYYDNLRERARLSTREAARRGAIAAIVIPVGVAAVLLVPLWVALILLAIPAVAVAAMAMAS